VDSESGSRVPLLSKGPLIISVATLTASYGPFFFLNEAENSKTKKPGQCFSTSVKATYKNFCQLIRSKKKNKIDYR